MGIDETSAVVMQNEISKIKVNLGILTERVDRGFEHLNGSISEIKNNHLAHLGEDIKELQTTVTALSASTATGTVERKSIDTKVAVLISVITSFSLIGFEFILKLLTN